MISRQKLIEELKRFPKKFLDYCGNKDCMETEMCDECINKMLKEIIESQPPADQWIPCKTCDKRCDRWENSEI